MHILFALVSNIPVLFGHRACVVKEMLLVAAVEEEGEHTTPDRLLEKQAPYPSKRSWHVARQTSIAHLGPRSAFCQFRKANMPDVDWTWHARTTLR